MAGIYIHIPFCKQACHYCDFHFSTSLKKKTPLLNSIKTELELRKNEISDPIATIYFGGGTPSLLSKDEIEMLYDCVTSNFTISDNPEITLEANPDDLNNNVVRWLASSPINRLSIGVQSFFEEDLKLMNRAHSATEAIESIKLAQLEFSNLSLDLIYGIPGLTMERWIKNVQTALDLQIPHLSAYALTVEPKTALESMIRKGLVANVDDDLAHEHHSILVSMMKKAGYVNYEFSNFSLPGHSSRNNMAYWQGSSYLGVGPSAHSYDGQRRSWNVANNTIYIDKLNKKELPIERETLSKNDKYNEYIMTRLRLAQGIDLTHFSSTFGNDYVDFLEKQKILHLQNGNLVEYTLNEKDGDHKFLRISEKAKFLTDGIACDLFII